MKKKYLKNLFRGGGLLALSVFFNSCSKLIVLNSKGPIGQREAELIYTAFALMLIVVVPVIVIAFLFAIRYRASNKKATYKPEWAFSKKIEIVIWAVPVAIILVLSYLTWTRTHELDPYKPIKSENKQLLVDVISTSWNWIFVYPEENIASINELVIETGRPVSFRLTSSSVMNSFFIPQLGSQIYTMAGMQTKLNLLSQHDGVYDGRNMEYSGEGYNKMTFKVLSKNNKDFNDWLKNVKQNDKDLNMEKYVEISQPHSGHPVIAFSSVEPELFEKIMAPYMEWMGHGDNGSCCSQHNDMSSHTQCCPDKQESDSAKTSCCHNKEGEMEMNHK